MPIETHPYKNNNGLTQQLNFSTELISAKGYLSGGIWLPYTKTIFTGTFPPLKEYQTPEGVLRKGYLHFSSPRNKFWQHVDKLYGLTLHISGDVVKNEQQRIDNALAKIDFLEKNDIGFIDIFSKVDRRVSGSSKDIDLIPIETIFEDGTFDTALRLNVKQFCFVYSLSRDIFMMNLTSRYPVTPEVVRAYNIDGIPLEVTRVTIEGKEILLSYSPIHGNITDERKRSALKKVIDLDL